MYNYIYINVILESWYKSVTTKFQHVPHVLRPRTLEIHPADEATAFPGLMIFSSSFSSGKACKSRNISRMKFFLYIHCHVLSQSSDKYNDYNIYNVYIVYVLNIFRIDIWTLVQSLLVKKNPQHNTSVNPTWSTWCLRPQEIHPSPKKAAAAALWVFGSGFPSGKACKWQRCHSNHSKNAAFVFIWLIMFIY